MKVINVDYAILCDDVRREDNGKLIYIGIYENAILLRKFPASLRVFVALKVTVDRTGEASFDLKAKYGGEETATGEGVLGVREGRVATIPIGPLAFREMEAPGQLEIDLRFGDDKFQTIVSIPVREQPDSSPSEI